MKTQIENRLIEKALLIRTVEESLLYFYAEGKVSGTLHSCIGQEFAAATVGMQLNPDDAVVSNHRGHGHYLAFTDDVEGLVREVMGFDDGCSLGFGGTQHLHHG